MDNAWLIAPETRSRTNRLSRRHPHRLANLFERFVAFLSLEKELRPSTILTYRRAFADFLAFAEAQTKAPLLTTKFNTDLVRAYQYDLAERELRPTTVSLRLAVLASFSKWAVREGKLHRNPLDPIVRPSKRTKLPDTLRWDAVQKILDLCRTRRDRAIVTLMAYGGLRRSEVVALDIGDFDPTFGLRRVCGKGGHDAAVPLPKSARSIVSDYLHAERPDAAASESLFLVSYSTVARKVMVTRMASHRVWKLVCDLGERSGIKGLHPHPLRHACAVELLRRTKNLRAVQQHLRHRDIQTTTIYATLMPDELAEAVSAFDA